MQWKKAQSVAVEARRKTTVKPCFIVVFYNQVIMLNVRTCGHRQDIATIPELMSDSWQKGSQTFWKKKKKEKQMFIATLWFWHMPVDYFKLYTSRTCYDCCISSYLFIICWASWYARRPHLGYNTAQVCDTSRKKSHKKRFPCKVRATKVNAYIMKVTVLV